MKTKTELKAEWVEAEFNLREAGRVVSEAEAALRKARDTADRARLAYETEIPNTRLSEKATVPETVQLNSSCLLSKWGFGDGDELDWLHEHGDFDKHAVLVELVKTRLLPALAQKVEVEIIETIHNPVRAASVDGEDVTKWHYEIDCPVNLTPAWVIVTGAEVLALAQEIARNNSANSVINKPSSD